jgi:hypothetical protein
MKKKARRSGASRSIHGSSKAKGPKAGEQVPQGRLSDSDFKSFLEVLATQEIRGAEWEQQLSLADCIEEDMSAVIAQCSPVPSGPIGVHHVTQFLYDAIRTACVASQLTPHQWGLPTVQRYLRYVRFEVPCLVRSLSQECERRGISSSPLASIAVKWNAAFVKSASPRAALIRFNKEYSDGELEGQLSESVQRLLRITEIEARDDKNPSLPHQPMRESSRGPTRRRRKAADPPKGWIYFADAAELFRISKSTLQDWSNNPALINPDDVKKARTAVNDLFVRPRSRKPCGGRGIARTDYRPAGSGRNRRARAGGAMLSWRHHGSLDFHARRVPPASSDRAGSSSHPPPAERTSAVDPSHCAGLPLEARRRGQVVSIPWAHTALRGNRAFSPSAATPRGAR